jgi:hypothetical protein
MTKKADKVNLDELLPPPSSLRLLGAGSWRGGELRS